MRSLLYSKPFESEEKKYRKSMEPLATQNFFSKDKRLHKHFNVSEIRLVHMEENPFIRASSDSNADSSCCGSGLFEVKCPGSIKSEKPSHKNLSFLTLGEDYKVTLKENHPFFTKYKNKCVPLGKIVLISLFIHTLGFIRKELDSVQKFGKTSFKIATVLVQIFSTWNSITKTSIPPWKYCFTWPKPSSAW